MEVYEDLVGMKLEDTQAPLALAQALAAHPHPTNIAPRSSLPRHTPLLAVTHRQHGMRALRKDLVGMSLVGIQDPLALAQAMAAPSSTNLAPRSSLPPHTRLLAVSQSQHGLRARESTQNGRQEINAQSRAAGNEEAPNVQRLQRLGKHTQCLHLHTYKALVASHSAN